MLKEIPNTRAKDIITDACIILEGGAFRGLYTQGVLDALMLNDINIHTVIGVSAGSLSGMNYVSGQIGRSARTYLRYRHNKNFIGLKAFLKSKSLIRLDFILKDYNKIESFDEKKFYNPKRRFIAVCTNIENGKTLYFEKENCSDMLAAIKASASMPFISPIVEVDKNKCLDGGCSTAIPYQWALEQGFKKIIVVTTHEISYRNKNAKIRKRAKLFYPHLKEFSKILDQADIRYNATYDELERLQNQKRIYVISPSEKVKVKRLEKNVEKLHHLYQRGYNDVMNTLLDIKEYLDINDVIIRTVKEEDAQSLLDIYSYYVENTAITFEYEVPTLEEFKRRIRETLNKYPYIVYEKNSKILGYAYASAFHQRPAYNWSVETSIYVDKNEHNKGVGKALYNKLEEILCKMNITNANACIAYTEIEDKHLNNNSKNFHEKLGYELVGRFTKCGYKFDTWYDMIWMQKHLQEHTIPAKKVLKFTESIMTRTI